MTDEQRAALNELPWRGPEGVRPALPLPPAKMPLRFAGGWRKRWRYVSSFGERLMICAASVQVGPGAQTFWAVLDRESGELHEHTRMRMPGSRGEVWNEDSGGHPLEIGMEERGAVSRFASGEVKGKLTIGTGTWQQCVAPAPDGDTQRYAWTRKRIAPVSVDVTLPGGQRIREEARGVEDESAGYHPRHTSWRWSAGIGTTADGREIGWNLVSGINDLPEGSERAVWIDGQVVAEPAPVIFDGLDAIEFGSGSRLEFTKEAERAREESKAIFKSSYRQPFGTFSGSLDGVELASGIGVMESHDAVW
ncbi:MAG: DUF2804 family protein [Solirubrobacterales bacterium]